MWGLFIASGLGVIALGIFDWDAFVFTPWMRFGVGMPLWVSGNALALWAIIVLGLASTFGGEGALIKRGPYAISRNPQYVGFIAALIGWSVLTNSALTLVAVLVGVIPHTYALQGIRRVMINGMGFSDSATRSAFLVLLLFCVVFVSLGIVLLNKALLKAESTNGVGIVV
jgi:hypothetical protein